MFNRNLFLLVRSIYIARPIKIESSITPSCFNAVRLCSKKSSSGKDKDTCEPCQEEPEPDNTYGCETPTSRYPTFPLCGDEEEKSTPKKASEPCGPAICPPPKSKPPCTPVCTEEPKKPVVCPPKSGTVNGLRLLSLLVIFPAIIALSAYVFTTRHEIHRPPFVEYPYMRKKNAAGRKWPWNSDKSLFYNSRVNALYDGYEEEEELEEVVDDVGVDNEVNVPDSQEKEVVENQNEEDKKE